MISDSDLLALCVLQEAGGEVADGKAAVARVIKNRMALKYESDGTIAGTVLKRNQFSWLWWRYVGGHPIAIAFDTAGASIIAQQKLGEAMPSDLELCRTIAQDVIAGMYQGSAYDQLTDAAVMYLNAPFVLKTEGRLPSWASPAKQVCVIGHHTFYHA